MKLPQGPRMGVQSLGRNDINAPLRQANAEMATTAAMASAVGDVVNIGGKIVKEHEDNQVRDRSLEIQQDLEALYSENDATQQWDLDDNFQREKLEGVQFKKKDQHGNLRTVLDSAEVHGQIWSVNRDKIIQQGTSDLSAPQQKAVRKNLSAHTARLDRLTQHQSIQRKSQALKKQDIHSATNLVKADKLPQAVAVIADSNKFSDIEKVSMIQGLRVDNEKQRSDEILFGGDVEAIAAHMMDMSPEVYNGLLEPREVEARRREAERQINVLTAESQAAAAKEMEQAVSDLSLAVDSGEAGHMEIQDAFDNDLISGPKMTQLKLMSDRAASDKQKSAARSTLLADVVTGQRLADPYSKELTSSVNEAYAAEPKLENALELIRKTGVMPSAITGTLNAAAHSGSPRERVQAANFVEQLQREKPIALRKIPEETKAILEMAGRLSPNTKPEQMQKIIDGITSMEPAVIEARQLRYKAVKKSGDHMSQLDDLMDSDDQFDKNWGPFSEVSVDDLPDNITGDYRYLHEKYFMLTGDGDSASKLAFNDLRAIYSATDINGDWQAMKYAPDVEHNIPAPLVKDDFKRFKKAKGLPANATLVPDLRTSYETQKTYGVYVENEFGMPVEQGVRYAPSREKIEARLAAEAEREAMAAQARHAERKRILEDADVLDLGGALDSVKEFLRHKEPGDPGHSSTDREEEEGQLVIFEDPEPSDAPEGDMPTF